MNAVTGPALTTSFSVFPALNVGDVDAHIETASPVLGLRPVRAGKPKFKHFPDGSMASVKGSVVGKTVRVIFGIF